MGNVWMYTIEKILIGIVLGAVLPILGFLVGWWGTFAFLPERGTFLAAASGFLLGLGADAVFLKRWVENAYMFDLKIWMAVYLFYSLGMFGFFMGVPVFNVLLAVPTGLFTGSRLARHNTGQDELRQITRNTCIFTTGVLGVVCLCSAAIALSDPYTASGIQGMLGLPFEIGRRLLVGAIVIGGRGLLAAQWLLTAALTRLTYAARSRP